MTRPAFAAFMRMHASADSSVRTRAAIAEGWIDVCDSPDLLLLSRGAPYIRDAAADANWFAVGTIFDVDVHAFERSADVLRLLTRGPWGAYVAFERSADRWWAMRDPSGRMPCWSAEIGGWRVLASDLSVLREFGWRSSGVDWGAFADLLRAPRLRDGRTGLQAVTEVLPGEAVDANGARRTIWSPTSFALASDIEDIDAARRLLREVVLKVVSQWAERPQRILHLLSGGLDSSVVLGCLGEAGFASKVRCLNYTRGAGSELDEERYARAIAGLVGVDTEVGKFEPERVDLSRASAFGDAPRPTGYTFALENDDFEVTAAEAWHADACFSAAGGDGLFYQLRAKVYCADYLRRHGAGAGLAKVAYDSAKLIRASVWTTLGRGIQYATWRQFDPTQAPANPYLTEGVGQGADNWLRKHPWFSSARDLAPGKLLHLWALLDCLNLFHDYRRAEIAPTILPLVSQPLIEAVLRMPSYVLTRNGIDRTLLREAFADVLAPEIQQRAGKGAMDGYYAELCAQNSPLIRETLLGGELASRGLINVVRIERDLPKGGDPADGSDTHLLRLFAAEMWTRRWR